MNSITIDKIVFDWGILRMFVPVFFTLLTLPSFERISSANDIGLIRPQELNRELKNWIVLDARPKSEWLAGHLPGARSFSWEDYTRTDKEGVPYRVWPPEELSKALGDMGIDENTSVVIYGDADKSWGGEGWSCWVLLMLGHKGPIRLLDGGIQSWRNNNFPISKESEDKKIQVVHYQINLRPEIDITTAYLEQKRGEMSVVDVRSTIEWFKGHIPGAIHISWTKFYSGGDRHTITPDELKRLLKEHGVDTSKPIVYYCAGGIRSSYAWLVHELSGLPSARNYEGGMEAWQRRPSK